MNMNTDKLVKKLQKFFDLSTKKQSKKHDKLLEIIDKLEHKKDKLEKELFEVSEQDATSTRYHELSRELSVIGKLIKNAKERDVGITTTDS
jgi:Mg2+ and Co2+ transporter CorA